MSPISRYRPTKSQDGEGGWSDTLGAATTIYVAVEYHSNRTTLVCDANEDVKAGDVLLIDAEYYRVTGVRTLPGTQWQRCDLEKTQRPVSP